MDPVVALAVAPAAVDSDSRWPFPASAVDSDLVINHIAKRNQQDFSTVHTYSKQGSGQNPLPNFYVRNKPTEIMSATMPPKICYNYIIH